MLVGRRGEHLAGAGQDVHLQHRLVRQAVAKRRGLDAEPGDGPAERDRLQLRHHQRRQPVGQRGGDEVLVRAHPGHIGGPGLGVDRDDARQPRGVQALDSVSWPAPGTGSRWVWPAEPWRFQGWPDSSREAAARPRRERPVRRSQQQTQIYASPRPRMPRRGMTSGGVHSPAACRRRPGCSSACGASNKVITLRVRDAPLAGLAQFLGSARRASVGPGRRRPNSEIGIPGRRRSRLICIRWPSSASSSWKGQTSLPASSRKHRTRAAPSRPVRGAVCCPIPED